MLEVLKYVDTRIKALKTILGISLDNYKLKKLLCMAKPKEFKSSLSPIELLYEVMCLPEVRAQFESRINYYE
jgi:hypothetical protein